MLLALLVLLRPLLPPSPLAAGGGLTGVFSKPDEMMECQW